MNRVLIIDDDELIAGALYRRLVDSGLVVEVATDPGEAESFLRSRRYALVVMDAYMTGQLRDRATDLVDKVRRLRGRAHLVLVTAYGSDELARRAGSAGDVTIVTKPASVRILAEVVEGLLGHIPIETRSSS